MAKKSLVLESPLQSQSLAERLAATAPVVALAAVYSNIMEERIDPRRAFRLLNAQAAVLAAVFPADFSVGLRLLFFLWAGAALLGCRKKD